MRRSGFTLIELLMVLAIMLTLMAIGVGLWAASVDWWERTQTNVTLLRVHERLAMVREQARRDARAWETPAAIYRLAEGNKARAEALKVKYVTKWLMPESYAEVEQGLVESVALDYPSPSAVAKGHPSLTGTRRWLLYHMQTGGGAQLCDLTNRAPVLAAGVSPAQDLQLQNAACLAAVYRQAVASGWSLGDLAPAELGGWPHNVPDLNPVLIDRWGTPLRFRRWGEGQPLISLPDWVGAADADDPDGLLQESDAASGARTLWWDVHGRWFVATFRHDPTRRPCLPLVILSAGRDRTFGTEDDLDNLRAGTRRQ